MLGVALVLAYTSSLGAALFSMAAGYTLIPHMSIQSAVDGLRSLPEVVFKMDIPPIMGVMSALVFSVMIGLAATWTKAVTVTKLLDEFQKIVLEIVQKIVIPILRFTSHLRSVLWPMREPSQNRLDLHFGYPDCYGRPLYLDGAVVYTGWYLLWP